MSEGETAKTGIPRRIGEPMTKADWREAIQLLKASSPEKKGQVFLPRENGEYEGRLMLVTDTHLVQRVGRDTAVAHDLSRLTDGMQIAADFETGKVELGQTFRVRYATERGGGSITTGLSSEQRAKEVRKQLAVWAEAHITNPRGQEIFLRHVDSAIEQIAAKPSDVRATPNTIAPSRTLSPLKTR